MANFDHKWEHQAFKTFGRAAPVRLQQGQGNTALVRQLVGIDPVDTQRCCGGCGHPLPVSQLSVQGQKLRTSDQASLCLCVKCYRADNALSYTALAKRFGLSGSDVKRIEKKFASAMKQKREIHLQRVNTLTFSHLLAKWAAQGGVCALSGRKMHLPGQRGHVDLGASIDRIDNDLGYQDGNVQWTCWGANRMKAGLCIADFAAWCSDIARTSKISIDDQSASG